MSNITFKQFFDHFAEYLEFIGFEDPKKTPEKTSVTSSKTKIKYKCLCCTTTYDKPREIRHGLCTTVGCELRNDKLGKGKGSTILNVLKSEKRLIGLDEFEQEESESEEETPEELTFRKLFDHYSDFYEANSPDEALNQVVGGKLEYKIKYKCKMCDAEYNRESLGTTFICNWVTCVLNRSDLKIDTQIMNALKKKSLLDVAELLEQIGDSKTLIRKTPNAGKSFVSKTKAQRIPKLMDELSKLVGIDRDLLENFIRENRKEEDEGDTGSGLQITQTRSKGIAITGTKEQREAELQRRKAAFRKNPPIIVEVDIEETDEETDEESEDSDSDSFEFV